MNLKGVLIKNVQLTMTYAFLLSLSLYLYYSEELVNQIISNEYGRSIVEAPVLTDYNISSAERSALITEVANYCVSKNATELTCLGPYNRAPTWLVSRRTGFAYCNIEKVMSQSMTGVGCFLEYSEEFVRNGSHIYNYINDSPEFFFCMQLFHDMWVHGTIENQEQLRLFTIVRDPMERFVSNYIDKCINEVASKKWGPMRYCYFCVNNMTCTLDRLYNALHYHTQKVRPMSIEGFNHRAYEINHFSPQAWYCRYNDYPTHVIKYYANSTATEIAKKMDDFLQTTRSTAWQRNFVKQELEYKSPHTTFNNTRREQVTNQLLNNALNLSFFLKIYFIDYRTFNFTLPSGHNADAF